MRKGIELGKLFGIKIRLDWSWLLILLLVTWNVATAFGDLHGDWSAMLRWGLGLLAALLFFTSVLAHELAHSLVARARGMPVHSITLFLFGGISNLQEEPASPSAEFWMAILGPITSLLIGIGVLAVLGGTLDVQATTAPQQLIEQLGPIPSMLAWLGSVNVSLGLFNLIPGFPLDGGRVLRSILWAITGDLRKATHWASMVGQGVAWTFIVGGVAMSFGATLPFFGSGVGNGLWLAFIGWFLSNASNRSYRQVVIQDVLEDVPVTRMMRTEPPTVTPATSVAMLIDEYVMQSDDHAFPVVDAGDFIGLVTLDDVRSVPREQRDATTVREIMTPRADLVTVDTETDAGEALMSLAQHDVRQLPVVDTATVLQGLLRRRDIVKWLQLHAELNL